MKHSPTTRSFMRFGGIGVFSIACPIILMLQVNADPAALSCTTSSTRSVK